MIRWNMLEFGKTATNTEKNRSEFNWTDSRRGFFRLDTAWYLILPNTISPWACSCSIPSCLNLCTQFQASNVDITMSVSDGVGRTNQPNQPKPTIICKSRIRALANRHQYSFLVGICHVSKNQISKFIAFALSPSFGLMLLKVSHSLALDVPFQ